MSVFSRALEARLRGVGAEAKGRRWVFVAYDQLSGEVGPIATTTTRELGIVLVECPEKAARRPYHRQKLALVLSNLRHFALQQAERGVVVRHLVAPSYRAALETLDTSAPITMMRAAERELRTELLPLVETGRLTVLPHEGWLTTSDDFRAAVGERAWRMDAFYRHVRKRLGVLMENGKPVGGRWSFDAENRSKWRGEPSLPTRPTFAVDDVTREVCDLVLARFARHPGTLTPEALPTTAADAERAWTWAKSECLASFGPFEDAMAAGERHLFHTMISPLLNLQRLSAKRVLADVLAMDLPLASQEGFVRQILGWREYMRHVHEATDGFRVLRGAKQPCAEAPGDGGHGGWSGERWTDAVADAQRAGGGDGGSLTSVLGSKGDVPPAYWGAPSGLRCLDDVVKGVWDEGYSHHITRLMVLSNIAMLLDVAPRALTDWFWAAYVDAYDWVVEANVHGMSTFGVGDLLTTKPYVAGSAYIDKMSDYCGGCRFDPKTTCPLTPMYWAFLGRHRNVLEGVDRMKLPLAAEARRTHAKKRADAEVFERTRSALARGEELVPEQRSPREK